MRKISGVNKPSAVTVDAFERAVWSITVASTALLAELSAVVVQHNIHAADGSFLARVDLAIPSVRPGIEAHSRSFHAGTHQEIVDQR